MADAQGVSLDFLHRVVAMASVSLDSLPHNGAIVTLLLVCGLVAAHLFLTAIRLVQGVAVDGEWDGAALMALEHSPTKSRGFATSFATAGGPAGAILATLALSATSP